MARLSIEGVPDVLARDLKAKAAHEGTTVKALVIAAAEAIVGGTIVLGTADEGTTGKKLLQSPLGALRAEQRDRARRCIAQIVGVKGKGRQKGKGKASKK